MNTKSNKESINIHNILYYIKAYTPIRFITQFSSILNYLTKRLKRPKQL